MDLEHSFAQQSVQRPLDDRSLAQAGSLNQAFHLADHHEVGDLEWYVEILVMLIKTSSIYIYDLDEAKHEMDCVSSVGGQEAKGNTYPRGGGGLDPLAWLGRVAAHYNFYSCLRKYRKSSANHALLLV